MDHTVQLKGQNPVTARAPFMFGQPWSRWWVLLAVTAIAACGDSKESSGLGSGATGGSMAGSDGGAGSGGAAPGRERDEPTRAQGNNAFNDVTEPVAGQVYPAGTRIHVEALGVSFSIPTGWAGAMPADSEVFILEKQGLAATVFMLAVRGPADQARQEMATAIDLGDGIVLQPDGALEDNGGILKARYNATGTQTPTRGYIAAVIGGYGITVLIAGLAATAATMEMESAVDTITSTIGFKDPQVTDTRNVAGDDWSQSLSGKKLQRFYTGSGYSEHEIIWLCSNGQAARLFDSGGVNAGANFSAAHRSDYAGTWRAYGGDTEGTLELAYNDNTYTEWTITYEDGKLFLDGGRWFQEPTDCTD